MPDTVLTRLVPWFGANGMAAHVPGRLLGKCAIAFVPFAGGLSELPHIDAREIVAGDLHADLINMAGVIQNPPTCQMMRERIDLLPMHPDVLTDAQRACTHYRQVTGDSAPHLFGPRGQGPQISWIDRIDWAAAYYVVAWMGRSALPGTDAELRGGLAVRFNAGGGASSKRWQTALAGIEQWGEWISSVVFQRRDCFELLDRAENKPSVGIYCDPPWPDDGDRYAHAFTERQQRRLAGRLQELNQCRIVVRINDHPLSQELYEGWMERMDIEGRTQANTAKAEVVYHRNCGGGG